MARKAKVIGRAVEEPVPIVDEICKLEEAPVPQEETEWQGGPRCWCGKEMAKTTEEIDGKTLPYWVCLAGTKGHDAYPA